VVLSFVAISEKIKRNPDDNIFIAVGLPLKLRANHTFNKILFCVCLFGGFRLRSVFFGGFMVGTGAQRCLLAAAESASPIVRVFRLALFWLF